LFGAEIITTTAVAPLLRARHAKAVAARRRTRGRWWCL